MRKERAVKRKTMYILGVVVVVYAIIAIGAFVALRRAIRAYTQNACLTEERLKIVDHYGFAYDVVYENCDTLAKEEDISVYAKKVAPKGYQAFTGSENQRTLLFRYDPMREDSPLPTITRPSQSTILISIPEVSSIIYQNRKWENMSVTYEVGRVYYPATTK
jgi:hypothetical protein